MRIRRLKGASKPAYTLFLDELAPITPRIQTLIDALGPNTHDSVRAYREPLDALSREIVERVKTDGVYLMHVASTTDPVA